MIQFTSHLKKNVDARIEEVESMEASIIILLLRVITGKRMITAKY